MSIRFGSRSMLPCLRARAAALTFAALAVGCAPIAYRPNEGLTKELGLEEAKKRLKEIVIRARQAGGGIITSVDVTDEVLKVKAQQTTIGMFYQAETRQLENDVYFPTVEKVDIYENNWAYVYVTGGRLVLQVLLVTPEDAKSFADLVMSFRDQRLRGRAAKA
ncbi:MAG: hypothetical protein ACRDHY_18990 [Anaerolineales bacterium]